MPREPKPEWVQALRELCGAESDLRFNETAGRWEFVLPSADGILRSQFWGWFYRPRGQERIPLEPDPETGLHQFRDLDDTSMREALANLEHTFIGNPFDGAGSTTKEVRRRMAWNADHQRGMYRRAGEAFVDMVHERARRLRGGALAPVLIDLSPTPRPGAKIEVASVIGGTP